MATNFPPPPTYAEPVIVDEATQKAQFNPIWLNWFVRIAEFVGQSGGGTGGGVLHNSLPDLQGGAADEYFHFTAAEHSALSGGFVGTGPIVRQTNTALITPDIGKPDAGDLGNCSNLPASGLASVTGSGTAVVLSDSPSFTGNVVFQNTLRLGQYTTTQKNAIAGPTAGMLIFDTTLNKMCVYSGTAWETVTSV